MKQVDDDNANRQLEALTVIMARVAELKQHVAAAEALVAALTQERDAARELFWPHDNERDEHIYEIRNGKNEDYVRAHARALTDEAAESLAASRLAEIARAKAEALEEAAKEYEEHLLPGSRAAATYTVRWLRDKVAPLAPPSEPEET